MSSACCPEGPNIQTASGLSAGEEMLLDTMENKPTVLILRTGPPARSHLAEGILRVAARDLIEVESAGSKPAGYVHPFAVQAMSEIGIDISNHRSKHLNEFRN